MKWTETDLENLTRLYEACGDGKVPVETIASVLGRTPDAVKNKARSLGLKSGAAKPVITRRVSARSGKRESLGGLFLRSSWEASYAHYLNFLRDRGDILGWQYEPKTFHFPIKRGNKKYTPDFLVQFPTYEEWHEVKGWMDKDSQIKLRRFAKYYPDETLIIIDRKAYKAIEKEFAHLIEGWEY